jgi:hypothetical protein
MACLLLPSIRTPLPSFVGGCCCRRKREATVNVRLFAMMMASWTFGPDHGERPGEVTYVGSVSVSATRDDGQLVLARPGLFAATTNIPGRRVDRPRCTRKKTWLPSLFFGNHLGGRIRRHECRAIVRVQSDAHEARFHSA